MEAALDSCSAKVVASATLAFGALSGRGRIGRSADVPDELFWQRAFEVGDQLRYLAAELNTTPARLAIAFTLANPGVTTALFGASRPEQVHENAGALELLARMGDTELATLRAIGA
jgi:aryl-alcohol dehydrogenase-like predicted oxidoreductase